MEKIKVLFNKADHNKKENSNSFTFLPAGEAIEIADKKVSEGKWVSYNIPSLSKREKTETFSGEKRRIECNCNNWEELDVEEELYNAHNFTLMIKKTDGEGIFLCNECEEEVESETNY
jgi:hypothetical protein